MLETPFTIEALGSGTLSWDPAGNQLEYSKNGGPWTTSDELYFQLIEGDEVAFKGVNTEYNFQMPIQCTASFNVKGNIMSLVYGDNFKTASTLTVNDQFYGLFSDCVTLVSAGYLQLPATTLVNNCYASMFSGCTSLTTAPELPATTLAAECYYWMFFGCSSLTTAPELPATTLTNACYASMFYNCSSLNYIKCLATDISATDCTDSWVSDVSSTGTFVKNASATWTTTGVSGIPTG